MARKEYMRDYMANKRNVNKVLTNVNKTPENVNNSVNNVNKELPKEWRHVVDYISRPVLDTEPNEMPNLERLQRIAGSLGKYAGDVWFSGLTMQEIGETIGTMPPEF